MRYNSAFLVASPETTLSSEANFFTKGDSLKDLGEDIARSCAVEVIE